MSASEEIWILRSLLRTRLFERLRRWGPLVSAALLAAVGPVSSASAAPSAAPQLTATERAVIVDALNTSPVASEAPAAGASDAILWASLVRAASAQLGLRVQPSTVDPLWAIAPRPRQVEAEAQAARAQARLGPWLGDLQPSSARYRALAAARDRYRRIVDAGGWLPVPATAVLRPRARGPAVAALRDRLAAEGFTSSGSGDVLDAATERALIDFQRHHELQPDGVAGPATMAALNVRANDRLEQIEANLERWRWLPALPADRIEVDIGGAEATLYADDAPRLSMRAVVGDVQHKTPMFASKLEAVVFNPPWNVPASIAAKELLPHERADPGYLARNDFVLVDGALQQRPGPRNALGQLKFDLPSPFGVYLHDTPGRAAFARQRRWLSHGCIRLEKPRELAAAALGPQGWTAEKVDAAIAAAETSRVGIVKPIPLYVLYWTVVIADDGQPDFRPDTYGWDAKLTRALADSAPDRVKMARADTGCAAAKTPQPVL